MLRLSRLATLAIALIASTVARAQSVEEFYRGKTFYMLIGTEPGGAYDAYARLLGRHIGRHIPGEPVVVSQNMPGAASLVLANHLYNVIARDGLAIGAVQRGMPLNPLYAGVGASGARYDATKFTWIGSINNETGVVLAMKSSGINRFEDLFEKEMIVGAEGGGTSDSELFARLSNAVLGTKARIVTGYKGSSEVSLALDKGEVNGQFVGGWVGLRDKANPWIAAGRASLILQLAVRPDPRFPGLPVIMDFAHDERQKQILRLAFTAQLWGRPYVAPPGLPPERAKALRDAFQATMVDPAFVAEANRFGLDIGPLSGEEMADLIAGLYASPKDIVEATRAAFHGEKK